MAALLPAETRGLLALVVAIAAFAAAGLYVGSRASTTASDVDANRTALTTVCSTMTILGIVFEQLRITDRNLASDPSLERSVRNRVRQRAALYSTAVEALNETNRDCEQIE